MCRPKSPGYAQSDIKRRSLSQAAATGSQSDFRPDPQRGDLWFLARSGSGDIEDLDPVIGNEVEQQVGWLIRPTTMDVNPGLPVLDRESDGLLRAASGAVRVAARCTSSVARSLLVGR